ncbi:MAG: anaerobic ribonucleoside-triphosphate reductase activating protein [Clostridiaceae bacterium]|jgi:pyruvate formate lyase activating enzyme|nr:anaerobic ribonucleoside-triphosphate reductase activating protein [Clostridiaceae bacterium]
MLFKGIQKTSFVDYPGKISTAFFTAGCNFKCPYCHNGHLVNNQSDLNISEEDAIVYLETRKRSIDAVVISGGEPTLFGIELITFLEKLKELGYLIKLDTNGTNPDIIKIILDKKLVNYIAMDIKSPIAKYEKVVNANVNLSKIIESIKLIKNSEIDYEFRTTVTKELLLKNDIIDIIEEISPCKKYYLQNFNDGNNVLEGKGVFHPVDFLNEIKEKYSFIEIR